jgi:hypothetical protein
MIDAYDDVTLEGVKKLAEINSSIYVMSPEERSRLRDHDFALSIITKKASKLNKFPVNNHDNTWLSNEYFSLNHGRLPKVAAEIAAFNIKTACTKFRVKPSEAVESFSKEAADSNVYFEEGNLKPTSNVVIANLEKIAQVEDVGNNYTHAQYALSTPSHVKVAGQYFEKNASKMPVEVRHKYAAAIQRRAKELGMPVQTGMVQKYASDYYSPMVEGHLASRRQLLQGNEDMVETLNKIGAAKKGTPPAKFAQVLHAFDKKAGLNKYYGGYLTDPYQATFASEPDPYAGYTCKTASRELTGDEIKKFVVAKYDKIKEYLGKSVADEMKKEPIAIFDSLPKDAKEIMVEIADGTI